MLGFIARLNRLEDGQRRIENGIQMILDNQRKQFKKLEDMDTTLSQQVQDLGAAVAENTSVESSAVTLLQNLSGLISGAASSGDLAQVEALAQQISASSTALAASIAANTPAAPVANS